MKFLNAKRSLPKLPEAGDHTLLGRLKNTLQAHSYIICSFLVPLILYWAVYIFIGCYPFGENSVLVLDLNGQYIYFFEGLRNALHGDASLIYSWSRTLGGEFIGLYAYYLASPLSYLVFFFSTEHITEAILIIILLKCGISGATMSFYLKKTRPAVSELWVILFSTMYALSGYTIAYAHNTMWMDAYMLFPLVIYGVEQLIKKHKCTLFVVTLTLTVMSTFYIGYMVCIFVFFYFFYYYAVTSADHGNNYYGEKWHFVKSLIRIGVSALTSLAISAVILIPTYYAMTFGKTTFTDPSWEMTSQFDLIEFCVKLLPGGYDTVRPDGLPFVYCGVLTLLFLPVFFLSKKVKLREKIGASLILAFMLICMENSITDLIWHCFQRPNWLNYRYSFIFIFLLVVYACRGAEDITQISKAQLAAIGAALIGLVVVIQAQQLEFVDTFLCIWLTILLTVGLLGALAAYLTKHWKTVGTVVLCVIVCGEMVISGLLGVIALDNDVVISNRTGYVEYMNRIQGIVSDVQKADTSFYRMEKTIQRNVCDNMALNIRGISNSTSTLNASAIRLLHDMGYSSQSHWSEYKGGNPVSDSLLGLKYIIYDGDKYIPTFYESFKEDPENTLYAYLNTYALSLAYATDSDILDLELRNNGIENYVSPFEAMNAIVTAMLGSEETIELFKPIEHSLTVDTDTTGSTTANTVRNETDENGDVITDENGENVQITRPYYYYNSIGEENGRLRYTFYLPEDAAENSSVYFYFATEYPRSFDWKFRGDDQEQNGKMFGDAGDYIQALGNLGHEKRYALEVTLTSDDKYFYVMQGPSVFYYLDEALFTEVFTKLAEGNFIIDDDYSESHLTGSINVPEGRDTVFTSIPYDEGWNIYVDGKQVEPIRTLDALMAFEITPGQHTIELKYCSDYMVAGLVISIAGLVVGILLWWIDRRFLRRKLPAMRKAFEIQLAKEEAARLEQEALERERLAAEAAAANVNAEPTEGDADNAMPEKASSENTSTEQDASDKGSEA